MKTETKMLAVLGIVVALCSMLFVASPITAIAAEEDDYVLGVYGNANEDDTIDMRDLTYVKLIFFGKKPETELADAKYDGTINPLDFIQIKLIIVGKEKELTVVDSVDRIVTVKKPVERIAVGGSEPAVALRILGMIENVVGVETALVTKEYSKIFFPEFQGLPTIGEWEVDYEAILSLKPDVLIVYGAQSVEDEKLPGVTVLHFDFYRARKTFQEMKTLGYVLDGEEDAQEYIDFCEVIWNDVEERIEKLPYDDRITVYIETAQPYRTHTRMGATGYQIELAGGRNIAADLLGGPTGWLDVEREWVVEQDPEIIIKMAGWNREGISAGYETSDPSDMKNVRAEIMSRAELATVEAVQNKKIDVISFDVTYTPDFIVSVAYLTKWFYPEVFEDLDPQAIHQEYLDTFHESLCWNVYERGVFVYPQLEG